jgi:enterobactin synthetase component D
LTPFAIAYHHATAHGVLTAVHIPDSPDPVPEDVLARLPKREAAFAKTLRGYRQVQFMGGRIAVRRACEQMGLNPQDILADDRGAPQMPAGTVGSISHKRTIAVGMVARAVDGTLGVDIEEYAPARLSIASAVLTEPEIAAISHLDDERRWIATLLRFSIKESIYKALDPYVRRYVGFHEARVTPDLHGHADVELSLVNGEGPFLVDARYEWLHGRLLTTVRIRPA